MSLFSLEGGVTVVVLPTRAVGRVAHTVESHCTNRSHAAEVLLNDGSVARCRELKDAW